jgi:hypothetical protein
VQFTKPRFVRRDIELGGLRLKKGDRIMAMLAAANMDPEANPHPEKLDLARKHPIGTCHSAQGSISAWAINLRVWRASARCKLLVAATRAGGAIGHYSLAAAAWTQSDRGAHGRSGSVTDIC